VLEAASERSRSREFSRGSASDSLSCAPSLPEKKFPGLSPEPPTRESSQKNHPRLFSLRWERRLLLSRVRALLSLASNAARLAFLIRLTFISTAHFACHLIIICLGLAIGRRPHVRAAAGLGGIC